MTFKNDTCLDTCIRALPSPPHVYFIHVLELFIWRLFIPSIKHKLLWMQKLIFIHCLSLSAHACSYHGAGYTFATQFTMSKINRIRKSSGQEVWLVPTRQKMMFYSIMREISRCVYGQLFWLTFVQRKKNPHTFLSLLTRCVILSPHTLVCSSCQYKGSQHGMVGKPTF